MLTNVPRTMRVALCLSHEFHTCHSEPRVGANADKPSLPNSKLVANTTPPSRRMFRARFGLLVSPSAIRGRRECRAPDAPESRVCRDSGREHTRSQVTPESPGIPYAMVYGLYRALPGDRLSCHRRRRSCLHRLDTSVGVSGPRAFAVRLKHPRQEHHRRPPHPAPRW